MTLAPGRLADGPGAGKSSRCKPPSSSARRCRPCRSKPCSAASAYQELMHRPVVLRGTWQPQHTVFLDNRQMQGKPGFYVVTPLKLEGGRRGCAGRARLGAAQFRGPREAAAGADAARARSSCAAALPRRRPSYMNSPGRSGAPSGKISTWPSSGPKRACPCWTLPCGRPEGPADGLLRDWPEAASGAAKNYGYAFQWWALSALIAILYVWFQFIVPRRKAPHA